MEEKLEKWIEQTEEILSNLEKAQELTEWRFMQTELQRRWPGCLLGEIAYPGS